MDRSSYSRALQIIASENISDYISPKLYSSVLIGLFENCARTNAFRYRTYSNLIHILTGCVSNSRDSPTPYKTVHWTVLYLRSGRAFESHLEHKKSEIPERASQIFGASVLIGLFENCTRTNILGGRTYSYSIHIPTGCVWNMRDSPTN